MKSSDFHSIPTFCEKCWVAGISNMNYKQGFCTNAEVFIMDEGIEMMPIEQTSSEPQFPWWVSQVSTDEDKIGALKARADSTSLASGNAEVEISK